MNEQIKERIKIIDSYKSSFNWGDKSPEQKYKFLKWYATIDFFLGTGMLLFLTYLSLMRVLNIEPWRHIWEKAGLLVLLVVSISLRSQFTYIELLLSEHRRKILNLVGELDEGLNTDFKKLISRLTSVSERLIATGAPVMVIFIAAFLQFINLNPIWDIFAYIIPVFGIYMLIRTFWNISAIRKNIFHFEKACI
jgi:hypothetical protein